MMIKIEELRIGSYLLDIAGVVSVVTKISSEYVILKCEGDDDVYVCDIDDLRPIKLTEELLSEIKPQLTDAFEYRYSHGVTYIDFKGNTLTAVSNFHEIQNFIYTITGNEISL